MSKNNVSNISPFVLQRIIFGVTTGGPVQSWSHYVERLYKKAQGISGDILPWQLKTAQTRDYRQTANAVVTTTQVTKNRFQKIYHSQEAHTTTSCILNSLTSLWLE